MKISLEIPDNMLAAFMELLQGVPYVKQAKPVKAKALDATQYLESNPANHARVLAAIEGLEKGQHDVAGRAQLFRSLFGAWQSEESGEELNRQLREARQSTRPDIEL